MLSLLYRGWAQAQPAVSFDRPAQDRFGIYLASLSGTGMPAFQDRDAMPDLAKRHYAGHLVLPDPPRGGAQVDPAAPCWVCRYASRSSSGTGWCCPRTAGCGWGRRRTAARWAKPRPSAGGSGTISPSSASASARFGLADYLRLLPGGEALARVKAVVRNYVGDQLDWDLNPVLARGRGAAACGSAAGGRLGWTTWLASGPWGATATTSSWTRAAEAGCRL